MTILLDLSLYLNSITNTPKYKYTVTSGHFSEIQPVSISDRMVSDLRVIDVKLTQLLHTNIVSCDHLHLNQ